MNSKQRRTNDHSDDEGPHHSRDKFTRERRNSSRDRERDRTRDREREHEREREPYLDRRKRDNSVNSEDPVESIIDRRFKRRRSLSPRRGPDSGDHYIPNYDKDGYTPAPRYRPGPDMRFPPFPVMAMGFNGQPPQMMQPGNLLPMDWTASLGREPPKDPAELDFLVTFKYYADYIISQNPKKPPEDDELHKMYSKYKEEFSVRQLKTFFDSHKAEEWFQEKYHPTHIAERTLDIQTLKRQLFEKFIADLKNGKYDSINNEESEKKDGETKLEEGGDENPETKEPNSVKAEADEDGHRLFIKSVPPTIQREKIVNMCKKVEGFKYLALSEPNPSKKFHRLGWIVFDEKTNMDSAFEKLNEQKVDEFTFYLARHKHNGPIRNRTAPEVASQPDRIGKDKQRLEDLIKKMDKELSVNGYKKLRERLYTLADEKDPNWNKMIFDMCLEYARQVHLFCYYCGGESDSVEEFNRKCPGRHLRKKISERSQTSKEKQASSQWLKALDHKINIKLDPESTLAKIKLLGGKSLEEERKKFLDQNTVEMEPGVKFRCSICSKLFKGQEYVHKHIFLKHPEKMKLVDDEVIFLNNYVIDPNHLLPTTPPNPTASLNAAPNVTAIPPNPFPVINNAPPPFLFNFPTILGAAAGTPHDQIPRIGFDGRNDSRENRGQRSQTERRRQSPRARQTELNLTSDPRQVKSYIDLDAPAEGDIEIRY